MKEASRGRVSSVLLPWLVVPLRPPRPHSAPLFSAETRPECKEGRTWTFVLYFSPFFALLARSVPGPKCFFGGNLRGNRC